MSSSWAPVPQAWICARDLADMGFRTVIVEQSLALGGGFWHGGYLINKATICAPADKILEEVGVPCKQIKECDGMYMADPRMPPRNCRRLQRRREDHEPYPRGRSDPAPGRCA